MKIPGLFTKSSRHHRFEYKPRYYDPKKEEHDERESRLRREIALENGDQPGEESNPYDHRVRMKGAFQSQRKRGVPTTSDEPNYALIRIGILLIISLLLVGFFQWGGKVVYALFLIFPVWIYLRFFKKKKTN